MHVDGFKSDLKRFSPEEMYYRYVLTGSCASLEDGVSHEIRSDIARKFSVEYNNVIIVGSANLGFSIKPKKRYIEFGDESDVDVAIVCPQLFERVWHEVYLYDKSGAYWEKKGAFRKYLSKGWIRPDILPTSEVFTFSNEWWEYFRLLHVDRCPYKVTGGIYHSQFFLRQYQTICIEQCRAEI